MVEKIILFAAAGAGALAILLAIVLICCCARRKHKVEENDTPMYQKMPVVNPRTPAYSLTRKPVGDNADVVRSRPPSQQSNIGYAPDIQEVYPQVPHGRLSLPGGQPQNRLVVSTLQRRHSRSTTPEPGTRRQSSVDSMQSPRPASGQCSTPGSPSISLLKTIPNDTTKPLPHKRGYHPLATDDEDSRTSSMSQQELDDAMSAYVRSLTPEPPKELTHLGQVEFQLEYIYSKEALRFTLHQARDLPAMDVSGTSDPYVEVRLLETDEGTGDGRALRKVAQWKSNHRSNTLNPVFKEHIDFSCPVRVPLARMGFLVYVMDHDTMSKDDLMGHMWVPLKGIDLSQRPTLWRYVQPGKMSSLDAESLGEIEVGVSFDKDTHHLKIFIPRATQLPEIAGRPPDTFVKVQIYHKGRKIASRETSKCRCSCSPEFQAEFNYRLNPSVDLTRLVVCVTVYRNTKISRKAIGVIKIGASSEAHSVGIEHWGKVMSQNATAVLFSHSLQPKIRDIRGSASSEPGSPAPAARS